eukprot:scaffold701_cov158-Amphora_coffeaeformis.AAC.4
MMIKTLLILFVLDPVTSSRINHNLHSSAKVGENGSKRSLRGDGSVSIDSSPKFYGRDQGDIWKGKETKSSTEKDENHSNVVGLRGLSSESSHIGQQRFVFAEPIPSQSPSAAQSAFLADTVEWDPSMIPSEPLHLGWNPSANPSIPPKELSATSTSLPTLMPSSLPSDVPSMVPTTFPTTIPTAEPSAVPSDFPSRVPSNMPSWGPTFEPTETPSFSPSDFPSTIPTLPPESLAIISTGMDNLRRYGKQSCDEVADPEIGSHMQRVVINYKYSLRVQDGSEPIITMGSIEDFITDFLRKFFCANFNVNGRRVSFSKDVVFTASPADMLSGDTNINNASVDGGFTLWIENDTMDGTTEVSATMIVCELLERLQSLFDSGALSYHPGVQNTKLESITSCQAAMAVDKSIWQLSFVVVGSGAFVVLAMGLAMRHLYISESQKAIKGDIVKAEDFYFDVTATETADTTMCTREDLYLSRSDSLYSSPWQETGYIYQDAPLNESHSSAGSIHSEFAVAGDNEHCHQFDNRETIVIDSKLFSLTMKTIPEAEIIECSSNEGDDNEQGYETIALD